MNQTTAVKILASGRSAFITGAPGAGKTHLLNRFIAYLQKRGVVHAITAPTGIAATHIGGITLHSWSGLGIQETVNDEVLFHLLKKPQLKKRFLETTVLIIDEVSMLTPGLFTAVDEILRSVRGTDEPFGGVQVVLSGDFFQLPPIQKNDFDGPKFIWETSSWEELSPEICYLEERHRHTEADLITLLDEIRSGEVSEESQELLSSCYHKDLPKGLPFTRLYTHNTDVDRINNEELSRLPSPLKRFTACITGKKSLAEKVFLSSLVQEEVAFKKGALVIFIKNNFEKGVVNGTLGEIIDFDEKTNAPMVKIASGEIVFADPEEWKITDEWGNTLVSIAQIPLRLAWAITVHKSQGMTLDSAEIDLSKAFTPGQGYVALSRVKNIAGLRLLGINKMALQVDEQVLEQDFQMKKISKRSEKEFLDAPMVEVYQPLSAEEERVLAQKKHEKSEKIPTMFFTKDLLKKGLSIEKVAEERGLTSATILKHLYDLKQSGNIDFSISHLLPKNADKIREIIALAKESENPEDFTESGEIRLSAVFRAGNEVFSYDDIRLVMTIDGER